MIRKITSDARLGATPQRNDASVNPVVDSISRFLRPKRPASQPVIGRMMALATRYDVNAHVASSVVADMLLAMCGSDTLTTVVSSTSMKVASMTAIVTIHGLTCRDSDTLPPSRLPPSPFGLRQTSRRYGGTGPAGRPP